MKDIAEVGLVTAITGYLKCWSIIAKTYLSLGKSLTSKKRSHIRVK